MVAEQIDLGSLSYFIPLISFLVVFIIVFAVLQKTKVLENKWVQLFVSFLFATVFVTSVGARGFVSSIIPWFAILMVCLFLIFIVLAFVGKDLDSMKKGIGITFVVLLIVVFLVAAIFFFSSVVSPYLPGGATSPDANPDLMRLSEWITSSRIGGGIILIIVSAVVSWVLVRAK